ncbi:MAG: c-type cytochrome [Verrucomicrobiia bacterium]
MNGELKPGVFLPPEAEPTAARSAVPIWIIVLTLVLLFLGAVYFDRDSGWFDRQVYLPYTSAEQLAFYQPRSGAAAMAAHGRGVYETVCGVCHGSDGLGKPGQAPPLAGSEWVAKDLTSLARIPLTGLNGPIQVKGVEWNLAMAPMGAGMSDADLASVLTYIRGSWGNNHGAVSVDDMKSARAAISGNAPSEAELAKMTPVERGHTVFQKYGCFQCHGPEAKGGVSNFNAKTAEQVPSLVYVADGYTKDELIAFIKRGERNIPRLNPTGPEPPHFMPKWGPIIQDSELGDLAAYLFSLKPKGEKLDF